MIERNKIIIRPMTVGEEKEVANVGRKAFKLFETLFVGTPKQAIVASYDDKIVGGIIYKSINNRKKKVVYIETAFVSTEFSGQGIGKMLYNYTFDYIFKQGGDVITALVKDDNVASWKLFEDNNFKKVSCNQLIKELGIGRFIQHYFRTPFPFAVGMDFYIVNSKNTSKEKKSTAVEVLLFFVANILLLTPLWIRYLKKDPDEFLYGIGGYITILFLFIGSRYIGNLICNNGKFRLNNGGSFLTFLLSFLGNTFPMNANWYPLKYENTKEFKRKLAVPELIKWMVFMALPVVSIIAFRNTYWSIVEELACMYLIFMIIPVYPFESLGGGRIYNYNKRLWLVIFIVTILELALVFNYIR